MLYSLIQRASCESNYSALRRIYTYSASALTVYHPCPFSRCEVLRKHNSSNKIVALKEYECHQKLFKRNITQSRQNVFGYVYPKVPSIRSLESLLRSRVSLVNLLWIRHKGHSKWQNIRATKSANDARKASLFAKICWDIRRAVKAGGPDPKINRQLNDIISMGHKSDMPMATMERNIKKALEVKTKTEILEISGPGGCLLIVELEYEIRGPVMKEIRKICKENLGTILPAGRSRVIYEKKGVLTVNGTNDDSKLSAEEALDTAIEIGAEDVQESTDEQEKPILVFYSDEESFFQVKGKLQGTKYIIQDAGVEYIPRITVQLSDEDAELSGKLYDSLTELEEVVNVYDNIQ